MPLRICCKNLRIYLEIRKPFLNVKEGRVARRLQIRICIFKQSIRFCCGVDPKPKEAYFSHRGFYIEKNVPRTTILMRFWPKMAGILGKNRWSHKTSDIQSTKKSHKLVCATCHYLGPKNCWEQSTEMLGYWTKKKFQSCFSLKLRV